MKLITGNIYHAGMVKEVGANSYFVKGEDGGANWLINSPEPTAELVAELKALGGVDYIFGTHRDVVCHVNAMAKHFNAKRVFHEQDLDAISEAEIVLVGEEHQSFEDGKFVAMPAPGHTEGHSMLLYDGRYLFIGDGCSFAGEKLIIGPAEWTWQSVELNIHSVKRLESLALTGIFPDHGKCLLIDDPAQMRKVLEDAVESAGSAPFDIAERISALSIYVGEMRSLGQPVQEKKMQAELDKVTAGKVASAH